MRILDSIKSSDDIKKLNLEQLETLSKEVREDILRVANSNGGHLSSNLGIVETTVALYYVFDFPKDKLIFDVGHQCYAYKLLSDRKDRFDTIRTDGGISGFTDREESEYDAFSSGHAGNSIAVGLGYALARDRKKEDYFVIDLVGDGSFVNGLNLEALTSLEEKPKNYIVILNDNGMSISKNHNGLYHYFSKHTTGKWYVKNKDAVKRIFGNSVITRTLKHIKNFFKRTLNRSFPVEKFGFKYVGIVDGNDVKETVKILKRVKEISKDKAVFLHINTRKGKGYVKAEEHADLYHGVGKNLTITSDGFGKALSDKLEDLVAKDKNIVAITAGMKDGTGLSDFAEKFPNNFYDVGIAEEYAVTLSAGMASGGLKPVVAVYSTFLQRAYDEILHDVCMQNLPVIFCIDRAGLVGEDGQSHQGVFDLSFLKSMPNLTLLAPTNKEDLSYAIDYALSLNSPVAIRYPKSYVEDGRKVCPYTENKWEVVEKGDKISVLAVGPKMLSLATSFAKEYNGVNVISARVVKPLDEKVLESIKGTAVFTLEENVLNGGFGESVNKYFANTDTKVYNFGIKDEFVKHGSVESQLKNNGITLEKLMEKAKEL